MAPYTGSIHRRPRSDSGAVRLWAWARSRRRPWTVPEATAAVDLSERRAREIVAALGRAGMLERVAEHQAGQGGWIAAEWRMTPAGRAIATAPVMVTDSATGRIVGVRHAGPDGSSSARVQRYMAREQLSLRSTAQRLGVRARTVRALLEGELALVAGDPILDRLR